MTVRFLNVTRCLNFSNFHIARMFSTTFWRGLLSIFLFCSLWLYFYFVKHKKVSNEINILERRTASAHQQYNLIIYMRNKRNGREPHWGAATAKLHIDFVFVCKSSSFCSVFGCLRSAMVSLVVVVFSLHIVFQYFLHSKRSVSF